MIQVISYVVQMMYVKSSSNSSFYSFRENMATMDNSCCRNYTFFLVT